MEQEIQVRKKRFVAFWAVVLLVCSLMLPTTVSAATHKLTDLAVDDILQPDDTITNEGNIFQVSYNTGAVVETTEAKIQSYEEPLTGQAFDGWKITSITEENRSGIMVKNITLTAQLSTARYTVTFDTAGGTAIDPITIEHGETVSAPVTPSKEGHEFDKWSVEFPYTVTENITITASWNINKYTITFHTDGGTVIEPITQDFGTDVTVPPNPTKDEYIFDGWDPQIPPTMPAQDMTITAKWKSKYIIEKGTHELTAGVKYQLGSGVTQVSNDPSTYVSGSYFYVPEDGSYTFS